MGTKKANTPLPTTLEEAIAQLQTATEAKDIAEATAEELKSQLETAQVGQKTAEEKLEGVNAKLTEAIELKESAEAKQVELLAVSDKKDKIINSLNTKITQLEKAKETDDNRPVIEIDGKEYTVNSGARVGSKVMSSQEIAEDSNAIESIMEIEGQTILTPVEETEEGD